MKKFLVIILCVLLCIVGLPFSANATAFAGTEITYGLTRSNRSCDCDAPQYLVNYPVTWVTTIIGTRDVCYENFYEIVRAQCDQCKQLYDVYDVTEEFDHTYAANGQCTVCGYWRASK